MKRSEAIGIDILGKESISIRVINVQVGRQASDKLIA